ncbi:MAG TPA: LysM peptidoglycan-binding domain-containing protein [Anaerovoracaceae bacterium]|nr:LysM peptidoglycan-binding domain-containing protein [Anaerovoracaceae bacterium]
MRKSKNVKSILLIALISLALSVPITADAYTYTPGIAYYTAVKGDSLFKISQVFYTNVDGLINLNNLNSVSVNIGQVLKVPADTYTVQRGDTLFLIAKKYKMPLSELKRANNIYTDNLNVGQRLTVPLPNSSGSAGSSSGGTASGGASSGGGTDQTPANPASYSAEDLDVLSRLIMAETQTEPYQAKVAVGAVVLNRVESGLFADSIKGVVYQNINGYYQFTPVVNGWINNPANADSIKAAKEALNGADPTNGTLWFYDDSTTNTFLLSKEVSVKIGHMVFAY